MRATTTPRPPSAAARPPIHEVLADVALLDSRAVAAAAGIGRSKLLELVRKGEAPAAAQLEFVFADIAESAKAIKRFVLKLVVEAADPESDERDVQAMHKAIEVLADRIGLLAD